MKKLLFVALVAAGMTACMQNEELAAPKGDAIAFENAYVGNSVRAEKAEDPSQTTNSISSFNVWGFMNNVGGAVFEGTEVTKNGNVWGYVGTQYWMPEKDYYFAALSPANAQGVKDLVLATGDDAKLGLGSFTYENDGKVDLLYAAKHVPTPTYATLASDGMPAVALEFQHLLSKVKFTFVNGFGTDNTSVVVTGLQMTAPKSATIDLTGTEGWTRGSEAVALSFGDVGTLSKANNNTAECANECLTIPASADYTYNVTFNVDVYVGTELAYSTPKEATISGYALEMGKAYNFTAEITPANLGLAPIEFTATVKEWDTTVNAPVANGSKVSNEAELAAALAAGGEYALAGNIALTAPLTVPAGKNVLLDLYSYTLSYEGTTQGEALINNHGSLTLLNTAATRAAVGTVAYKFAGQADSSYGKGNYTISNCGTLELGAGVVVVNTTEPMSHAFYAIDNNSTSNVATLVINEGAKVQTTASNSHGIRLFVNGKKNVVDTKGDIYGGSRAMWIQLPSNKPTVAPEVEVNIKGGSLNVTNPEDAYQSAIYSWTAGYSLANVVINVFDGAVVNGNIALTGGPNKNAVETVNVFGGTFNIPESAAYGVVYSYAEEALAAQSINIYDGKFSVKPNDYAVVSGCSTALRNGYYIVVPQVVGTLDAVSEATTVALTEDLAVSTNTTIHTQAATAPITIEGNGKSVVSVAESADDFQWEGTIPAMSTVLSSVDGSLVTVNDLTFEGTMSALMLGHYVDSNSNWYNTELNNVNVVDTKVVSFSGNVAPAVAVYGKATLNNCNVYGTTLSELDTDPAWPVYDIAVVNEAVLTLNNSNVGSIIAWAKSRIIVAEGSVVESIKPIYTSMNTNAKYGVLVKAGATVEVLDLSNIALPAKKINITIEEGATVGKVIDANGVEYSSLSLYLNTVDSAAALATQLAAGNDVALTQDLTDVAVSTKAPYGNHYGVAQNGGVFDGGNNVLDFDMGTRNSDGKYDNYGIMTSGGTIQNVTITGVFRGIVIMNPAQDLYIDNVTIGDDDVCYAINTAEGNGQHSVYVSNSTIKGWSSFGTAVKDLTFTNCTFAQGTYYNNVYGRLVKPYVTALFDGCEFCSKAYVDLSSLQADQVVTLKNCTVNGVKLTAENWTSLIAPEATCGEGQISVELKDGSYLTATNVADYVIFE